MSDWESFCDEQPICMEQATAIIYLLKEIETLRVKLKVKERELERVKKNKTVSLEDAVKIVKESVEDE